MTQLSKLKEEISSLKKSYDDLNQEKDKNDESIQNIMNQIENLKKPKIMEVNYEKINLISKICFTFIRK